MGALGEVSFFVALILVVLIHEAAHFGVAKAFRIKVTEFFVGFGPRIWSVRRGETEYGLKAIPAGGYVRIAGMSPYDEIAPEDMPRTYPEKPAWQRALVIVAGPATHFVFAFLCFAVWLAFVGQPVLRSPVVGTVEPTLNGQTSPAAQVGIRPGDRVVRVDGIARPTDLQLVDYTRRHVGEPITLTVLRDGRTLTFTVTPVRSKVAGKWVGRVGVVLTAARETVGPIAMITKAGRLVGEGVITTFRSVGSVFGPQGIGSLARQLFTNAPRRPGGPVSVVGAAHVAGQTEAATGRFWDILLLFGGMNIFIGLLNLLPLPPFDGGHLAVIAIEKIRGRKVDMRKVAPIGAAVAAFFILFTLSVLYLDIVKPINITP